MRHSAKIWCNFAARRFKRMSRWERNGLSRRVVTLTASLDGPDLGELTHAAGLYLNPPATDSRYANGSTMAQRETEHLTRILIGAALSRALSTIAELGVADFIHSGQP